MTVISNPGNSMDSETMQDQQTPENAPAPQEQPDGARKDQDALIAELGMSQGAIDALVGELRARDAQLEALATERNQHRLLHQVSDALGELEKLGGSQLFWGTPEAVTSGAGQLVRVREHLTAFESRIGEIEA